MSHRDHGHFSGGRGRGNPPATRVQYGRWNFSEGGAIDRWAPLEQAMRLFHVAANFGRIYEPTRPLPNIYGGTVHFTPETIGRPYLGYIPFTHQWYGVVRATRFDDIGQQTYLGPTPSQRRVYTGDTPLAFQPIIRRIAPWHRRGK